MGVSGDGCSSPAVASAILIGTNVPTSERYLTRSFTLECSPLEAGESKSGRTSPAKQKQKHNSGV